MYLRKNNKNYYELVKAYRTNGKVKTKVLKYIGKLTEIEVLKLKYVLQLKDIVQIEHMQVKQKASWTASDRVSLVEARSNVYKKVIDKAWLKNVYQNKNFSISKIAQLCGTSKDRIREHLSECGFSKEDRLQSGKNRVVNAEFGWQIIDGKKEKDPVEFPIIEKMAKWKNKDGLSLQKIANKLQDMGIKGRLGASKWDRGHIRRIIIRNHKHIENADPI